MDSKPELFSYGILTEGSDVRAHVGVASRSLYVFKTRDAIRLLQSTKRYQLADAYQDGVNGRTATGYPVPWKDIPDIRRLPFSSYDWTTFAPTDTTTTKGRKAVEVVVCCLRLGRFPLFADAKESDSTKLQITGTDIVVWHKCKIQVKCDWRCGEGPSCTGNIFLQLSERNPLHRI
jgi:hypothetical protein